MQDFTGATESGMLKLSDMTKVGRKVRQDDWRELGRATPGAAADAIDQGRQEAAKALAQYTIPEGKALHDLFCDWLWDLFTNIAERHGEEELYQTLRQTQGGWMMRRTWHGFLNLRVEERVYLTTEIMRAHRCGPDQDGGLSVTHRCLCLIRK